MPVSTGRSVPSSAHGNAHIDRYLYPLAVGEKGEPALDELELRTRQRLTRERERLEEATAQYDRLAVRRQVMQRRAASRSYDAAQASGGSD